MTGCVLESTISDQKTAYSDYTDLYKTSGSEQQTTKGRHCVTTGSVKKII